MPQRPIPGYWRERIKSEIAQMEQRKTRVSDRAIRLVLERHAEDLRKDPRPERRALAESVPSERSIARIRKEEWAQTPEAEQAQYREFYWPESMERGDLPWEASAPALELLQNCSPLRRPSIRAVRWFWRVYQATPDAPFGLRMEAAAKLMAAEDTGNGDVVRGVEWELAYGPWRSKEEQERYLEATERSDEPIPGNPRAGLHEPLEAGIGHEALSFLFDTLVISGGYPPGLTLSVDMNDEAELDAYDIVETTDQKEAQNG